MLDHFPQVLSESQSVSEVGGWRSEVGVGVGVGVLSCPVLSYPVLSCLVLSCLVLSRMTPQQAKQTFGKSLAVPCLTLQPVSPRNQGTTVSHHADGILH